EDVVMGTLTVRQNLSFSAALRLPTAVPQSEKEARVNNLIRELCLTKVADSKVGSQMTRGISGGERKRTNIGMELIIDPAVLFLDEPTSGLDASTANSVLLLLERWTKPKFVLLLLCNHRQILDKVFISNPFLPVSLGYKYDIREPSFLLATIQNGKNRKCH
ncbi:ATP-binding cassette sub- G member 2, partial [Xenoophorus captivus]